MSLGIAEPKMAKKKGVSVQIDEEVVKSARIVSALVGRPISTVISEILRPALAKMEEEESLKRHPIHAARKPKGGA